MNWFHKMFQRKSTSNLSAKISFSNNSSKILCLMNEPWGEDYWIAPGETFDLIPEPSDAACRFGVSYNGSCVSMYAEGNITFVSYYQNKTLLDCGHNRPPNSGF